MKCLTICQPHVAAIFNGPKRCENRTWATTYRGPLLIHAGKSRSWLTYTAKQFYADRGFEYDESSLVFGAVVGVAWLDGCEKIEYYPESCRVQHCAEGPECWLLHEPILLPRPVPARGLQSLFEVDVSRFNVDPEWLYGVYRPWINRRVMNPALRELWQSDRHIQEWVAA